jgi:hypothetical protein
MDKLHRLETAGAPRRGEALNTTRRFYRIDRRDISFLRFILEAYDGMAVLTTRDAALGIVSITMAPGCEALVDDVVTALAAGGDIHIEPFRTDDAVNCRPGCSCTSYS